jgi:hypothetical protein
MDVLVRDILNFVKQEFSPDETFFVSPEDVSLTWLEPVKSQPLLDKVDSTDTQKQTTLGIACPPQERAPIMTEETAPTTFTLEPATPPKREEIAHIRQLVAKLAPHSPLASDIPDDSRAKKISHLWEERLNTAEVILLSYGQTGSELKFLQNVTQAITTLLVPAKLIDAIRFEKENEWPIFFSSFSLKLIIAPDMNLWKKTHLSTFYKENPASGLHFFDKTPLLMLPPISHYLKNPHLKKQLWKTLVSHLSS